MARIFLRILALSIALATSLAEASDFRDEMPKARIMSHFAMYNPRALMTCDKFPKICHAKGSASLGHDCCRKRCVNVETDVLNCGECGKKCHYGQACCGGKCVNVMYDHKNCGGCKKKCKKGSFCKYGMCSYA